MAYTLFIKRKGRRWSSTFARKKNGDWLILYNGDGSPPNRKVGRWAKLPAYARSEAHALIDLQSQAGGRLRRLILKETHGRCIYCNGEPAQLTIDHLRARSLGGSHHYNNLAPACKTCNSSRGNQPPMPLVCERWRGYVAWKMSGCQEHPVYKRPEIEFPIPHRAYFIR